MKSTSTPWYVSNAYGNGSAIWIAPKEGPKMVLQGASCLRSDSVKYDEISIEQLQNNARLMAAAPDMLELLYRVLPIVEDAGLDPCYKPGAMAAIERQIRDLMDHLEQPV
jgi:hypothetical protein